MLHIVLSAVAATVILATPAASNEIQIGTVLPYKTMTESDFENLIKECPADRSNCSLQFWIATPEGLEENQSLCQEDSEYCRSHLPSDYDQTVVVWAGAIDATYHNWRISLRGATGADLVTVHATEYMHIHWMLDWAAN